MAQRPTPLGDGSGNHRKDPLCHVLPHPPFKPLFGCKKGYFMLDYDPPLGP
jgi:hypothetical protein